MYETCKRNDGFNHYNFQFFRSVISTCSPIFYQLCYNGSLPHFVYMYDSCCLAQLIGQLFSPTLILCCVAKYLVTPRDMELQM